MRQIYRVVRGYNISCGTFRDEEEAKQVKQMLDIADSMRQESGAVKHRIESEWFFDKGELANILNAGLVTVSFEYDKLDSRDSGPCITVREKNIDDNMFHMGSWEHFVASKVLVKLSPTGFKVYCYLVGRENAMNRAKAVWKRHKYNRVLVGGYTMWLDAINDGDNVIGAIYANNFDMFAQDYGNPADWDEIQDML